LLDLLDLPLAAAHLGVEVGAGLEHALPGLQLGRPVAGLGLPLGVADDAARALAGRAHLAVGEPLLAEEADGERHEDGYR
jgi:hypothetical protein